MEKPLQSPDLISMHAFLLVCRTPVSQEAEFLISSTVSMFEHDDGFDVMHFCRESDVLKKSPPPSRFRMRRKINNSSQARARQ